MSKYRVLVACTVIVAGLSVVGARAQDCDERFATICQRNAGPPQPWGPYQQRQVAPYQQSYQQPSYQPPPPYGQPYQSPYGQPYQRPYAQPPEPYQRGNPATAPTQVLDPALRAQYAALYAGVDTEQFPVPPMKLSDVDPSFLRHTVMYPTNEAPGTIVVDPQNHFLYLIQGGGRALRYGVGVGREGFGWSGVATVHDKQEWPPWYPPKEMLARQPEILRQMSQLDGGLGMAGGPRNPLGVRAMYLWQGDRDTLYRIHGTVEPWTIGKSVSSGCIRMINQDVIDLYGRTPVGARVVVLPSRNG